MSSTSAEETECLYTGLIGISKYMPYQCKQVGQICTGPTHKLLLSLTIILEDYRSFSPNKTTFTEHCLRGFHSSPGALKSNE